MSFLLNAVAFASEGGEHTHGSGGEAEHLYPVLIVFVLLVVGGAVFHFLTKTKK